MIAPAKPTERQPILYWFAHEVEYLRRNWSNRTNDEIAAALGMTPNQIRAHAKRLGVATPRTKETARCSK